MKILVAVVLVCLALSWTTALPSLRRQSCSCTADDGSCSASVTCRGGCLAFCPNNGGCRAVCVRSAGGYVNTLSPSVALTPRAGTGRSVGAEALPRTDAEIITGPAKAYPAFDFAAQSPTRLDTRRNLAPDDGKYSGGEGWADFGEVRRALLNGERVSACFGQVSAADLAGGLSSITGLDIRTEPEGATTLINYSVKGVTLKEMVAQVSALSGVRFEVR